MQSSAFVHTLERLNGKWELAEIIGEGTYGEVINISITQNVQLNYIINLENIFF